jgi:beta-phosphoglucomutase
MKSPPFQACIFDFDGVLIDSEPLHARAKQITLDHFRIPYPESIFAAYKGRTDLDFFEYAAGELAHGAYTVAELNDFKRRQYLRLVPDVPLVEGALAFLEAARLGFPKLGLATSATRWDFSLTSSRYAWERWFDAIVTSEDTRRHKPDPEPYLRALAALHVSGAQALVIEDSPNGIRAAKAAGCAVAALTTAFEAQALWQAGADLVAPAFAALAPELGLALR